MAEATKKETASKEDNVAMAVIAYFIFFLPLLTTAKDDPFVKYHVKQSVILLIASLIIWFLGRYIPIIGWYIINPIGGLVIFILWIIGVLNAASKKQKPIPIIGKYAELLKF
jgi:uncharacterized membrane protein